MIPDHDYNVLDRHVRAVLKRLSEGKLSVTEAQEDIMHPLTAWANGNKDGPEFVPWMKTRTAHLELS